MNEQDISKAVEAVLGQMNGQHAHHGEGHVCRCNKNKMTLKLANALIEKVKAYAQEMGVNVVIAVSDQAGRPVAVQCMDDAYIAGFDIELSHLSQPGQSLYGIQFTNQGKIVIFGGGEPLKADGKIIGALGVSGGSAEEDTAIAAYGKEIFEEVLACL